MRKILIILLFAGCAEQNHKEQVLLPPSVLWILQTTARGHAVSQGLQGHSELSQLSSYDPDVVRPDYYGFGVHANRFYQPVKLRPDFGGVSGEYLKIKPDHYGFGVHADQYGRPVREYPWP